MPSTSDSHWSTIRQQRSLLADQVGALDPAAWDGPSWCAGWRVRDVVGHLVQLAEATQASMLWTVMRNGGRPNIALDRTARSLGELPVPDLLDRLRAGADGRFRVIGMPHWATLGDVLVHGCDMLRPQSLDLAAPPADLTPVLSLYTRIGRAAFGVKNGSGVRLVATDSDWSHGTGPEVRGTSVDLMLLLANRRQVVAALDGPGLNRFA